MKLIFAGYNGFKQIPNFDTSVNQFCEFQLNLLTELNNKPINKFDIILSWSFNIIQIDNKIYKYGYVQNNINKLHELELVNDIVVKQICCNETNILVLSENNRIFKFNMHGECLELDNFVNTELNLKSSNKNEPENSITKISSSKFIHYAVSTKSDIYAIPSIIHSLENEKIIDICCGLEHCLILTEAGNIYSLGQGTRGQLGHGDLANETVPRLVEALAGIKVTAIAAGGWHSAAISSYGDLYTWGWNEKGQLGVKCNNTELNELKPLDNFNMPGVNVMALPYLVLLDNDLNILQVACGTSHTILLTDNFTLFGTGWNKYGQLGIDSESFEYLDNFTKIGLNIEYKLNSCILKCGPWNSLILIK